MESDPELAMAPRYEPSAAEGRWYSFWESSGYFRPRTGSDAPTFAITIPPPNITGELHMGHALTYGIEDILARFKRMQGFNTFVLPGPDHAGIATQNVVEKQLAGEGLSRHDIGREAFLDRVWQWKEKYAGAIREQFRALGCGFDWSHERFTMDAGYVDAVLEAFIRLYEEGQIYRGWRVINWCVRCQSAISDIEVNDVTREDTLYYLRYPIKDGGSITVATVRPETILGDVAVAVNPSDSRYREYIGKTAILPLLGRELPIIADEFVDREFGTGAVKITPAHDFADWEVAERHRLPMPIAIDSSSRITEVGAQYAGEPIRDAREHVLRDLESGAFLVRTEAYTHNVPTCERCGTLLEPLLSEQWFMRMEELAPPAIAAVVEGKVRFVPDRWERVYLDWMESIRPWTLSRQLWWGHRIPIYYCANGHPIAAKSVPDACSHCGAAITGQDPDVLDTWFSSALWPFAALGWPEQTPELNSFYPTSFMNTSSQILYLWIARMIMMGLKFRGEVPFPVVLINPTILTKTGQRMSKSLGTGVDPIQLVKEYGADALRFGLMTSGSTHQQDLRFAPERIEQARNFANKVWNIARAVLAGEGDEVERELELETADRWILSRLSAVTASVTADLERFEFSGAGHTLQDFVWNELADWYLEMAKIRLYDGEAGARFTVRAVLWSALERIVRLLHPFMPFLTEEIWQQLRHTGSLAARGLSGWSQELPVSVMIAPWPQFQETDPSAEQEIDVIREIVRSVRAARSEYRVDPATWLTATIVAPETTTIRDNSEILARLARLRSIAMVPDSDSDPEGTLSLFAGGARLYLPLGELIDVRAERERLEKELMNSEKAMESVRARLTNGEFVSRAPANVVERERQRLSSLEDRVAQVRQRLDAMKV